MTQPPTAKSALAATAADQSWLAHAQKEKQETPKRLEVPIFGGHHQYLAHGLYQQPAGRVGGLDGGCFVWATVFRWCQPC
ncbi:MAG: hypothetical protein R2788_08210 [Saprospiraceae bacterium]